MSFNTSTRKEDVSFKLRAVNLHKAHDETKQLEEESRQMEERLRELKMAMTREKEERERAQSGFWNKGKQGPLTGYAQDVLLKTKLKAQKAKKVKVLKDEPIVPPVRVKYPGTMAFIAQQGSTGKENKIKGPKCGQCEQKAAQVNCLECGEEYCASCFAAFHLRGNLKKHRSVPIGAKVSRTPRGNVTPKKVNHESDQINLYSNGDRTVSARLSERHSSKPSAQNDSQQSLLEGEYNEAESAATFQQALKAWRGDGGATQQEIKPRPVSPVSSPIVSTEHGTSTESGLEQKMPEITFHSSLSYAEKLMLKRHRRTELQPLPSDFTPRSDCRSRSSEYATSDVMQSTHYKDQTESFDDEYEETLIQVLSEPKEEENEGIQWQTIHRAMKSDNIIPCEPRSDSRLSIIELEDDVPIKSHHSRDRGSGKAHKPAYSVTEVGYEEEMEILSARKQSARSTRSNHSANKSSYLKNRGPLSKVLPSSASKQQHSRKQDISVTPSAAKERGNIESVEIKNEPNQEVKEKKPDKESRPQSCRRPKSSRPAHSRPQSRAMSRAETRLALFGEGELTKAASEALKEVAHMTPRHNIEPFLPTMSEFFTSGSEDKVESASSRVTTPSRTKRSKEQPSETEIPKWKVSYNLYNMGPRSWKPERSLQDQVDSEQAAQVVNEISAKLNVFLSPDEEDPAVVKEISLTNEGSIMNKPGFTNRSRPNSSHYKMATPSASVTPRVVSSRSKVGQNSLSRPSSRQQPSERTPRPESRAIVVDGDDLTGYDFEDKLREQDAEDEETLYQLEWELASQDGRITEDGKISRLSLMTTPEAEEPYESPQNPEDPVLDMLYQDDGHLSPGASLDTRMNNLMDDFEEMEQKVNDEEDVKALDS